MKADEIEAMVASPPERDDLVVQLFARDGGQWGEIYRDGTSYWIDLFGPQNPPLRLDVQKLIESLVGSLKELRDRLD